MLVFHFYEQKGYQTWLVHTSFAENTDEKELGNQNSVEESRFQRVIYTTPSKKSSPGTGNLVLFSKLTIVKLNAHQEKWIERLVLQKGE